jgi:hypothetical protein
MSYFYKYKFVSPDPLFARMKEELKSYFDAGMLDDLLFPLWTNDCLRKLGKSSFPIQHAILCQDNFEAKLPPDFLSVREAWMTSTTHSNEWMLPGSYYKSITTVLGQPYDACNPAVNCDPCNPNIHEVVAKTTTQVTHPIHLKYLLKPGNISIRKRGLANEIVRETNIGLGVPPGLAAAAVDFPILPEDEGLGCLNYSSTAQDTFDIRDGKFITNFRSGEIFLIYYGLQTDNAGYQLIPENYRVQEYIRAYLKQKLFEQLFNQISDESFNQVEKKYQMNKLLADEAFIMADIEVKKQTIYQRAYAIRRDERRLRKYELSRFYGRSYGSGGPNSSWGWAGQGNSTWSND